MITERGNRPVGRRYLGLVCSMAGIAIVFYCDERARRDRFFEATAITPSAHYGGNAMVRAILDGDAIAVSQLIDADPIQGLSAEYIDGQTALHIAAECEQLAIAEMLIERGADREVHDVFGRTALDISRFSGNKDLIRLFDDHD